VDMYGDAGAIAAVKAFQEATRELLFARYGRPRRTSSRWT